MKKTWVMIGTVVLLAVAPLVLMACGGSSPSSTPPPAASSQTVTLADNGKTITLRVGDSFLLQLGEDYNWTPAVDDQTIVSRANSITVAQGTQGVYDALKAGKTTLTAAGDPPCLQLTPPCKRPSIVFEIQIVVQ